jgi:hypothetical protein
MDQLGMLLGEGCPDHEGCLGLSCLEQPEHGQYLVGRGVDQDADTLGTFRTAAHHWTMQTQAWHRAP